MKKAVLVLSAVLLSCLLIAPAWADTSEASDLEALKAQLDEVQQLLQSQQQVIQEQNEHLKRQEEKIQSQEMKILDLEETMVEPMPYADTDEIVERVKAELPPAQDGFTLGKGAIRVTPYGFIRLDAAYDDSANFLFSGNVVGWAWPEGESSVPGLNQYPDDDESFAVTATATRIGLNFDGPEFADGNIRGKIEVDFDELSGFGGDVVAHRIRMRHAYAELVYPTWSLLAGQTWDVIAPRIPYMLDCVVLWGTGNVGYRRPQLRLTKWWDVDSSKITGQVSLNHQDRSLSDNTDLDTNLLNGVESGWPLLEGRLGIDTTIAGDRALSLGISGLVGQEEIDVPVGAGGIPIALTGKEDTDVWLVALDGKVTVIPKLLTIQGEIWTAENADNVYAGIVQGTIAVKNLAGDTIDLKSVEAYGGFVHAMLTPRKGLLFNVGAGIDKVDNDEDLTTGMRSENWAIFGNVIYSLTPNFDIGLELAYHETEWVNVEDGDLFRIQTAFIYKF